MTFLCVMMFLVGALTILFVAATGFKSKGLDNDVLLRAMRLMTIQNVAQLLVGVALILGAGVLAALNAGLL